MISSSLDCIGLPLTVLSIYELTLVMCSSHVIYGLFTVLMSNVQAGKILIAVVQHLHSLFWYFILKSMEAYCIHLKILFWALSFLTFQDKKSDIQKKRAKKKPFQANGMGLCRNQYNQ